MDRSAFQIGLAADVLRTARVAMKVSVLSEWMPGPVSQPYS